MTEPRISFDNRMWKAQDLSHNPHVAAHAMMETSWGALAYGMASRGAFGVYMKDNETLVPLDRLREDAISLALGIFTIDVPHDKACTRLICNCKIV